ncbi:Putative major facilitator superfamily, MFS transporter superfamily [Septoria linicola]|uniref:Major facilitator superfamily, MFS transporter superfamily n=1 Tax=Septoria linicola TaxID=215465 RepID=A0A9Q9EJG0_9PEZI|nr:putative major facilitator superfamily, MFS transporter superfamily [Septoria linicola]USW52184.1 Putative major facilitator superfamily, MFS transporter superfamily [Septoria linicola]
MEVEQRPIDLEKHYTLEPQSSTADVTIVTWYSATDSDNPHNWTRGKKLWFGFLILIYSLAVYIGASLYTAAIPTMKEMWGLGTVAVSVGLSIYVVGYGVGPLVLSPLSELPHVGRNPSYIIGFAIFVILCVPTALVDNFAGMLVLRFLMGFFGSPALASGGASYGHIYGPLHLPYAIALWAGGASAGPALGPLISNFAVVAENWRWAFWELLWLSGPVFLAMFFFLPETSADWILLQCAKRLRKLTGRTDLKAQCEIRQQKKSRKEVLYQALIKPWEINAKDPAVLFTTIYTGLIYGIYYSFFESFPLVFRDVYGWSFGIMGLAFLSIAVGCLLAVLVWLGYFYFYANKHIAAMMATGVMAPPETRLAPGLLFTFFIPAGLFIFCVTMSMIGNFVIAQCMLIYLPFTYPRYASSLFAANGLSRASLAAAAILFSIPMFENMGVDKGVTLLGGLCCGCCVGIYILYFFGAKLRKRSKFAES